MKSIKEVELKDKAVLVRCGFDVAIEAGEIVDDSRVVAGAKTIQYILEQKPRMVLIVSHLGRPEGKVTEELSNRPVASLLSQMLGREVVLIKTLEELQQRKNGSEGDPEEMNAVFMLENLRFWSGEKESTDDFSQAVAEGFDVYVNDAFSVSHRAHASLVGFVEYVQEKAAGLLLAEEFENLSKIKDAPEHPAVLVMGGAKIATKLPVIENMLENYDRILVGGKVANEAIDQKIDLGEKVIFPADFAPEDKAEERLDIGPETGALFAEEIKKAKTVVWNGPMGKFEDDDCAEGSKTVLRAVAARKGEAFTVVGGGETLAVIKQFGNIEDFSYVSMSGGAMLKFLSGEKLPGLEALED